MKEEIISAGDNSVTQDEDATAMFFIIDGMVEVVVQKPNGDEHQLTILKEGTFSGVTWLVVLPSSSIWYLIPV